MLFFAFGFVEFANVQHSILMERTRPQTCYQADVLFFSYQMLFPSLFHCIMCEKFQLGVMSRSENAHACSDKLEPNTALFTGWLPFNFMHQFGTKRNMIRWINIARSFPWARSGRVQLEADAVACTRSEVISSLCHFLLSASWHKHSSFSFSAALFLEPSAAPRTAHSPSSCGSKPWPNSR